MADPVPLFPAGPPRAPSGAAISARMSARFDAFTRRGEDLGAEAFQRLVIRDLLPKLLFVTFATTEAWALLRAGHEQPAEALIERIEEAALAATALMEGKAP